MRGATTMPNIDTILTMRNAPLIGVFSLLVLACVYFFFGFCVPYFRITSRLKKVNTKLHGLDETSDLKDIVPEALRGHFIIDKNLVHDRHHHARACMASGIAEREG